MPLPQSNHYPDTPQPQPRPSATGPLRRPHSDSKPYPHPAPSATQAQPPATPSRPQPRPPPGSAPPKSTTSKPSPSPLKVPTTARPRANSNPTSPVSAVAPTPPPAAEAKVRCSGMTKAGKQCNRMVVTRPPLGSVHPDVDVELERFCHQHVKELLKPPQFPTKAGTWIDFEVDWIPKYLHPLTQANLRVEMQKPLSAADECGFIYCFEIRDPDDDNRVYLKVGRTVVLNRRIDQWSKQCGSKEQYLRYWYPGPANEDDRVVMKGLVQQGDPGPWCHRLERLIHLELADLSLNAPYLDPQFPNIEAKLQDAKAAEKEKCPDCGKMHKEIFTFPKATHGIYVGREWEMLVKPVIEKWGRFVTDHLKKD
ncbi:hypothetical protein WOLCODRAFT_65061 [Wolfiporia cocos MD-104 SS10]|uniref:DUF1766-domain-containing protein n=1 Tax=Wolfiporia cocos (strain MD-104) TaxID=742152 RepID=A0A2H3J892_WOLCO|nr:hypothetical protein WOLCODRAFT_65061 [Wolfiporia cocos MD-104 SS10]